MFRILFVVIFSMIITFGAGVPGALAETKYSIKEMTPAVSAALESRRDRYSQISALKEQGSLGENNQGYVEAFSSDEGAVSLVAAENKDRKIIYETIAEQNGLEGALSTIEGVFGDIKREKAHPGEKIQNKDGTWTAK